MCLQLRTSLLCRRRQLLHPRRVEPCRVRCALSFGRLRVAEHYQLSSHHRARVLRDLLRLHLLRRRYGPTNATATSSSNATYFGPLSGSGVTGWTKSTPYPFQATGLSCVTSSGYIYCVGGFTYGGSQDNASVYYAPVSSSGIGAWQKTTSYPIAVYAQSCVTSAGRDCLHRRQRLRRPGQHDLRLLRQSIELRCRHLAVHHCLPHEHHGDCLRRHLRLRILHRWDGRHLRI